MRLRAGLVSSAVMLASVVLTAPGQAQTASDIEVAAKKEGALIWYAAMRSGDSDQIAQRFMKAYPEIKVSVIRMSSGEITARILTEERGHQFNCDIASSAAFAIAQLKKEKKLEVFQLPDNEKASMAKGTFDPEGYWVSQYVLTFPISYNPNKLKADGLSVPTSYEDFTKPEWAGKFAISSPYYDWYQGMSEAIGHDKAHDLAAKLAANHPLLREGAGTLLQLLQAGEFDASFNIYSYLTYQAQHQGRPVAFSNVGPVVTDLQTAGIAMNAPHPNAARLFQIWMAQLDTQSFLNNELGLPSTRKGVTGMAGVWEPDKVDYHIIDPDKQVEDARTYLKEFNQIFGIGG